jgi:hypothetical protein
MEAWKEIEGYNGIYFVSSTESKSTDHCERRSGGGKQTGRN